MNLNTTIKQNPVASFIVLTLGLSFAAFLLPVTGASALVALLCVLATIPTLVALALVTRLAGRQGVVAFLRQSFDWRSPLYWYVVACAVGFAIQFGSSVLAWATGRIATIALAAPDPLLLLIIPLALLEEIGWRGFALRRLLDHYSPFTATLLVAIPWAVIHFVLTLLVIPNRSPIIGGLIILALAVPHTWIFSKSGGNVLVATVLHAVINAAGNVAGPGRMISETETIWYLFGSACLIAMIIVLIDWRWWVAHPVEMMEDQRFAWTAQITRKHP